MTWKLSLSILDASETAWGWQSKDGTGPLSCPTAPPIPGSFLHWEASPAQRWKFQPPHLCSPSLQMATPRPCTSNIEHEVHIVMRVNLGRCPWRTWKRACSCLGKEFQGPEWPEDGLEWETWAPSEGTTLVTWSYPVGRDMIEWEPKQDPLKSRTQSRTLKV